MPQIVKVQVPLFTNDPAMQGNKGLVYDQAKRFIREQLLPLAVISALNGEAKGYFIADWNGRTWDIGKRTKGQDW